MESDGDRQILSEEDGYHLCLRERGILGSGEKTIPFQKEADREDRQGDRRDRTYGEERQEKEGGQREACRRAGEAKEFKRRHRIHGGEDIRA